jgi:hypothetical protein
MNSKVEADDKEATRINAGIEKQIRNDKKTYDRTVKILLLGMSSTMFSTSQLLTICRSRRIGQIHHHQTNAHHPLRWIPGRRTSAESRGYILESSGGIQGVDGDYADAED